MTLNGLVASPDGLEVVRAQKSGPQRDAALLGQQLADELLARGAAGILGRHSDV